MTENNRCPECGCALKEKNKLCPCGWRSESKSTLTPDYRCQYVFEGRRCPAKGTMCTSIRKNIAWVCSSHWWASNDQEKAIEALETAEKLAGNFKEQNKG